MSEEDAGGGEDVGTDAGDICIQRVEIKDVVSAWPSGGWSCSQNCGDILIVV
jgi:hypothetical protein